jgi:UDP-2,3-diacylglucosamine pyrophosphatase LpxH
VDLVIVSDLHLGPGASECVETFYNDTAFAHFLGHMREEGPFRLVILGDFIDFLRAELVTNPGAEPMSEAIALATLDRVIEGHPKVFDAIARFLESGGTLDLVVGNHDAELVRPALQDRLRATLGPGVTFHRWIYYVPGLLFAEHGHQYDSLNCFSTILEPFADHDEKVLERPIGLYLFCEVERLNATLDPCPDHASNHFRYFALAARRRPREAAVTVRRKAGVAAATVRQARAMSSAERAEWRAAYRTDVLPTYAKEIGLSTRSLLAIDAFSAAPKEPQHVVASQVLHRLSPSRAIGPLGRRVKYLEDASIDIHETLRRERGDVPFYVFGHSHGAQHLPLDFGPTAPQYLNTGTWSSIVSPSSETLRTLLPTFVHITAPDDGSPATARLLAWNNANGVAETLRRHA